MAGILSDRLKIERFVQLLRHLADDALNVLSVAVEVDHRTPTLAHSVLFGWRSFFFFATETFLSLRGSGS